MCRPEAGPFLFDTSAESWLARNRTPEIQLWLATYLKMHQIAVSAVTVSERVRGYSMLWRKSPEGTRPRISAARLAYLRQPLTVFTFDTATAIVTGEIMALLPNPPTPPRRAHRHAESRQERLARWRFDCMIAATALVAARPLLHNNAVDFDVIARVLNDCADRFPGVGQLILIGCSELGLS